MSDEIIKPEPLPDNALTLAELSDQVGSISLIHEPECESREERARVLDQAVIVGGAIVLSSLAKIYQNEYWKDLKDENGEQLYTSMSAYLQVTLKKSASASRRILQGLKDFYIPVSKLTVGNVEINIQSQQTAILGSEGLQDTVSEISEKFESVDLDDEDAEEEQQRIIEESLAGAVERKEARKAQEKSSKSTASSDGWDDGWNGRNFEDGPAPDALGPITTMVGDDELGDIIVPVPVVKSSTPSEEEDVEYPDGVEPAEFTADKDADYSGSGKGDIRLEPIMNGGISDDVKRVISDVSLYADDDERLFSLPTPTRKLVRSTLAISAIDAEEVAKLVNYQDRAVLAHIIEGQKHLAKMRSLIESSEWIYEEGE